MNLNPEYLTVYVPEELIHYLYSNTAVKISNIGVIDTLIFTLPVISMGYNSSDNEYALQWDYNLCHDTVIRELFAEGLVPELISSTNEETTYRVRLSNKGDNIMSNFINIFKLTHGKADKSKESYQKAIGALYKNKHYTNLIKGIYMDPKYTDDICSLADYVGIHKDYIVDLIKSGGLGKDALDKFEREHLGKYSWDDGVDKPDIETLYNTLKNHGESIDILDNSINGMLGRVVLCEQDIVDIKKAMYESKHINDELEKEVAELRDDIEKLFSIISGNDDSLDERLETLKHTMECLIERDDCFFEKVKDLKNAYSGIDKRVTLLEGKARPNISCIDEIIDATNNRIDDIIKRDDARFAEQLKELVSKMKKKDNLDFSSASFNIYFDKRKDDEDDD